MAFTAHPFIGTGSSVVIATGNFVSKPLSIDFSGISRPDVDVSHLGLTDWMEFLPGDLSDPGELIVEVLANVAVVPVLNLPPATIDILFPGTDKWSASGYLKGFEMTLPLDDKIIGTATFKFTGAIAYTAGA